MGDMICDVNARLDVLLSIGDGADEEWISLPVALYEELLRAWRVERTRPRSSVSLSSSKGA